jgi:hypothetical protein
MNTTQPSALVSLPYRLSEPPQRRCSVDHVSIPDRTQDDATSADDDKDVLTINEYDITNLKIFQ